MSVCAERAAEDRFVRQGRGLLQTDCRRKGDGMTDQNDAQVASYAGATTFMRRSLVADPQGWQQEKPDMIVFGVPFDIGTTNRPGARFGPRAIRAESLQLAWGPIWPWGFDPFDRLKVVDGGDVVFDWGRPQEMPERVKDSVCAMLRCGAVPVMLGGDHSCTLPVLRAMAEHVGEPLALIHFDAHRDVEAGTGQGRIDHGIVFSEALAEGLIVEEASVQIGIRTQYPDEGGQGMTVLDADWVHDQGADAVVAEIRRIIGTRPAYLSFDIDCLDPAFAPGTGTPVPGGLSTQQARRILRGLAGLDIRGFDVMEVSPPYDPAGITALAAALLAVDFCCLHAANA